VVLGGYLGSGKTTLVNEVLAGAGGARIVVVVNDFGAINVDADLVRRRSADTLDLANGCVCCSLADGMAAVMARIRAMKPPPELVLVEVSGVGNPAAVSAWARHPGFRPGGVVVCADAETVQARVRDRWVADTVTGQLEAADVLLLTKLDLVPPARGTEVREWLADRVPGVPILTDRGSVVEQMEALPPGGAPRRAAPEGHGDHPHRRWAVSVAGPVDLERVRAFLATVPESLVRAKGVLETLQSPGRRTVVQLAGRRLEITDDGPAAEGHVSSLVLIAAGDDAGRDLEAELRRALAGPL
jgi:G3E family GTPase